MSIKKHVSQMTQNELYTLSCLISLKRFKFTHYCNHRLLERDIREWQVIRAIREGEIIEYHYVNPFSQRVLVRGITPIGGNVPCVVVDIHTNSIITAYLNDKNDNHASLNTDNYSSDIDILYLIFVKGDLELAMKSDKTQWSMGEGMSKRKSSLGNISNKSK